MPCARKSAPRPTASSRSQVVTNGRMRKSAWQGSGGFGKQAPRTDRRNDCPTRNAPLCVQGERIEMKSLRNVCFLLLLVVSPSLFAANPNSGVEAFNHAFDTATRHMNNAEALALWEEDGVSLLPSTPPIIGRMAIAQFLEPGAAQLKGADMETFVILCHDI